MDGEFYVADSFNKMLVLDGEGNLLRQVEAPEFDEPWDIVTDKKNGVIYLSSYAGSTIQKLSPEGTLLLSWGKRGRGEDEISAPKGIDLDQDGNVYVVDGGNERVQVFSSDGKHLGSIGSRGTEPGQFESITDVAVLPDGSIVVVDNFAGKLVQFRSR